MGRERKVSHSVIGLFKNMTMSLCEQTAIIKIVTK